MPRRKLEKPSLRAQVADAETVVAPSGAVGLNHKPNDFTPPHADRTNDRLVDQGEIGSGGSGSVRQAYDPWLRRVVATKVLSPDLANKVGYVQRFTEEARVMARLDHPNIVPVHDLVVTEPSGYIVMKLIKGRTLEEVVQEAVVGDGPDLEHGDLLHQWLAIFLKVCDALAFAHSRGVIHCDLKPSNIMVGEFGEVYLMDWGIASQVSQEIGEVSRPRRKNRQGTPAFMSPEQAGGWVDAVTERTDIFGLGAVLYFLLTGKPPFEARTVTQSLALARSGKCESVTDATQILAPPGLARIVKKAMAFEPKDRFASVIELRDDVDQVIRGDWNLPTKIFAPGATIVREGDFADAAYIIVRGRCSVSKMVDGRKRELRILEAGDAFGETGVLSGDVRTATVEAITKVTVKLVTRELIHGQIGRDTWIGKFVIALADRFRELDAKITQKDRED